MANTSDDSDSSDPESYKDWNHELSSLQEIGEEILELWRAQKPQSPRDYPAVRWLNNNGYSNIRWVLREKHDMGTTEFFVLLTSAGGSNGYEWLIGDVATIERVKTYLKDTVECRNWSDSTKRSNRSRINQVFDRFQNVYGGDNIVALANKKSEQTAVYDSFKEVIKIMREELSSERSAHNYLCNTQAFFEWLARSGRIEYNPMEGLEEEFRWDLDTEPDPLSGKQVRRLWNTSETDEERILVVGYCIWGVRTQELPAIHVSQLNLDAVDPVITFEEEDRKNGQGEVSLMFGLGALGRLLDKRIMRPDWNGYLLVSEDEDRKFLSARRAREKFKNLCRKANVLIDGDVATPKNGRTFYYNILADAETDLLEFAAKAAEEQGATDAESVRDYYLTEERRRKYRRVFFRQRIRRILPEEAYTGYNGYFDSSLDDFE